MILTNNFTVASLLAVPLLLAACGQPVVNLCPDDEPGLGQSSLSQVFKGAAHQQKICRINASDIQPGRRHFFDGKDGGALVVDGGIPAGGSVTVSNGKLLINGNLEEGADISVDVPEETTLVPVFVPLSTGSGMIMITNMVPVFEGFLYKQDEDSAVTVVGNVLQNSRIKSNHGIHVTGTISDGAKLVHTQSTTYNKVTTGSVNPHFTLP